MSGTHEAEPEREPRAPLAEQHQRTTQTDTPDEYRFAAEPQEFVEAPPQDRQQSHASNRNGFDFRTDSLNNVFDSQFVVGRSPVCRLAKERTQMDRETIQVIAFVVCAVAGLCIAALTFGKVASHAFSTEARTGSPKSLGMLFVRSQILHLATVVGVVMAAVVLALADKLSDGAIALLSGISGFVLGGATQSRLTEAVSPPPAAGRNNDDGG